MSGPHDHSHSEPGHEHPVSPLGLTATTATVPPSAPSAPSPTPPEVTEDAGAQALSEALRSSFAVVKVIMIVLVAIFLFSGFFTVGTQEKALILRFGKPVGEDEKALLNPGPHWAFPYPIDEVVKIPVGQLQTVHSSVGWYLTTAALEAVGSEPPPEPALNPSRDGYALTADGNIIHVRGTMLYRISEPGLRYTFNFLNASNIAQNIFNNALLYASAHYRVDDILTRDVAGFRDQVRARVEQLVAQLELGLTVDQINVQAIPPRQVAINFAAVLEAEVRRSTALNDARKYENKTISEAKGQAAARRNAGETERTRLVEFVGAEAKRFNDVLASYRSNPELFVRQRQTEALVRILTNAQDRIILLDRADGQRRQMRLQLNREPLKPKPPAPAATEGHH